MSVLLLCRVCGEPWDAFGVRRDGSGDMHAWEAVLFLKGAGCPGCEGYAPEGADPDTLDVGARNKLNEQGLLSVLFNGIDDSAGDMDEAAIASLDADRPAWARPAAVALATCGACGLTVRDNPDKPGDIDARELDFPARDPHGSNRADDAILVDLEEWRAVAGHDALFCPDCVVRCDDCGEVWIFDGAVESQMCGDPYEPGASFLPPGCYHARDIVCVSCFEEYCSKCGMKHGENDEACEGCNPEEEQCAN